MKILSAITRFAGALAFAACAVAATAQAKVVCKDGVCYLEPDDGEASTNVEEKVEHLTDGKFGDFLAQMKKLAEGQSSEPEARVAFGYMPKDKFLAFLMDENPEDASPFADRSLLVVLLVAFLGGIALNLTPCVLPLVPINAAIIAKRGGGKGGRGFAAGLAYGAGMAIAYGALGIAAAFGGMAFGSIQSSGWFQIGAAILFLLLALAMFDVFNLDFSRFRGKVGFASKGAGVASLVAMGALAAVLAGACTAPVLAAALVYTSDAVASGNRLAIAVPFALGIGMAAPWPLLGAGVSALPKPGTWMTWVKRAMGLFLVVLALYYVKTAWDSFAGSESAGSVPPEAAERMFEESTKPVFVKVGAPWCKNCTAMDRSVLREEEVLKALEDFTVIKIRINDFAELANYGFLKQLKITGLPAYAVFPAQAADFPVQPIGEEETK